jgi:hypothetical protein
LEDAGPGVKSVRHVCLVPQTLELHFLTYLYKKKNQLTVEVSGLRSLMWQAGVKREEQNFQIYVQISSSSSAAYAIAIA